MCFAGQGLRAGQADDKKDKRLHAKMATKIKRPSLVSATTKTNSANNNNNNNNNNNDENVKTTITCKCMCFAGQGLRAGQADDKKDKRLHAKMATKIKRPSLVSDTTNNKKQGVGVR